MGAWEPIELDDALELVSSTFNDTRVREYAVSRLMKADNEVLYLIDYNRKNNFVGFNVFCFVGIIVLFVAVGAGSEI